MYEVSRYKSLIEHSVIEAAGDSDEENAGKLNPKLNELSSQDC